jgi:ring-1,2-phenylacetyl-CoA epoxidase subunit PaaC
MASKRLPLAFTPLQQYVLHLADNVMILGQRLGEWCGHGPVLEQDIALTNMSLDLIGQARMYYQYAAELMGPEYNEDDIAFLRDNRQYYNLLLVEQPNGDWGQTILRQFLFDSWHLAYLQALQHSADERLAAIAAKSLKEVQYHIRFSAEWVLRLGDGTAESHERMLKAIDALARFSGEWSLASTYEAELIQKGIAPNPATLSAGIAQRREAVFQEATLPWPENSYMQEGGKTGRHTEHLGYILAEMQFMQRAYPGLEW